MSSYKNRFSPGAVRVVALALLVTSILAGRSALADRDDWQEPDRVMEDLHVKPGTHVADVGCGRGYFTFRMARATGNKGKVFAVDVNEKALASVRNEAKRQELANIQTIHSEPTDTKLVAGSVHAALLCMVLHHVPKDQRPPLVESIAKALKPGGYLFVLDLRKVHDSPFHTYEQLVSRSEAIELAKKAGLSLDAEWYYLRHQYFVRFRKPEKQTPSPAERD